MDRVTRFVFLPRFNCLQAGGPLRDPVVNNDGHGGCTSVADVNNIEDTQHVRKVGLMMHDVFFHDIAQEFLLCPFIGYRRQPLSLNLTSEWVSRLAESWQHLCKEIREERFR